MEKIYLLFNIGTMKIGVIIPDRGDRPAFLENCLRMLKAQSLQAACIELVNDPPLNDQCDITFRYRTGYDRLRNKGLDLIAFIENDDWYGVDYLKYMSSEWLRMDRPDLLGTKQTVYYHIKLRSHFTMYHNRRSSAMNTFIRPDMDIVWCPDHEAFTDIHLWTKMTGKLINSQGVYSMGIKHGIGKCGARCHVDRLNRYIFDDKDLNFLKEKMDAESFNFYSNYFLNEGTH
jgi:hypothetical protein